MDADILDFFDQLAKAQADEPVPLLSLEDYEAVSTFIDAEFPTVVYGWHPLVPAGSIYALKDTLDPAITMPIDFEAPKMRENWLWWYSTRPMGKFKLTDVGSA